MVHYRVTTTLKYPSGDCRAEIYRLAEKSSLEPGLYIGALCTYNRKVHFYWDASANTYDKEYLPPWVSKNLEYPRSSLMRLLPWIQKGEEHNDTK